MQLLRLNGIAGWNALRRTQAAVKELFALLRSMLTIDPKRRPNAEEVLKHPWFNQPETA
jgi:serine/threonine protein kinase